MNKWTKILYYYGNFFLDKIMKSQKKYYLSHPDKETRKFLTKFKISDPCFFFFFIETGRLKKIQKKTKEKCKIFTS